MAISIAQIGWAAGFYEGEGSFIEPGYVSITQKTPEPLYKLWKMFGGHEPKMYNGYWYWRLYGIEMRQFVLSIFTLLSKRRKEQILKFKILFTTPDKCRNGHIYHYSLKKEINYRTGGSFRSCPICARASMRRKNNKRRKNSSSPQMGVN